MEISFFPGNETAWLPNTSEISKNDTLCERKNGMQKKKKKTLSNSEINSFWLHYLKMASSLKDTIR